MEEWWNPRIVSYNAAAAYMHVSEARARPTTRYPEPMLF